MSEPPATYTCDECGYQAADRDLVIAHLAAAHGITATEEVGSVTQRNGLLIKRIAAGELVVSERPPAYASGQTFDFTAGQRVICNGYPGTIDRVLTGQLAGMVEVRLPGGQVCVSACYPDCYPAPLEETAR